MRIGVPIGSLACGLAALFAGGCSNTDAGRPGDPPGSPRLVKLLVQDGHFVGGPPDQRAAIVDLFDDAAPPTCSDINPCINQYLIAQTTPPLECSDPSGGVCVDPLKLPATGVPLNAGDTNIRLVFNKLLANDIEDVMTDPNGAPLPGHPYALKPGIVELLGPGGTPVPGTTAVWDNSGSPDFTSDPILAPFGPSILITPGGLDPSTTYTVRIHPGLLRDRNGNPAADRFGTLLSDPTDYSFTTEPITVDSTRSFPGFSTPPTIAPNDILQFAFWEALDETTVTITATGPVGFDPTAVEAYSDRADSPVAADCDAALNPMLLDFVYTTGVPRMPIDWPAGDYTLSFTVKDASGVATYVSPTLMFTVGGAPTDPASDPYARQLHVTPEQCL
jgi:hypothetical protein